MRKQIPCNNIHHNYRENTEQSKICLTNENWLGLTNKHLPDLTMKTD